MNYKYIFVGAGVANLAAANRLMSLGINDFIILEKGNKLKKRHCPGVEDTTCLFCKNGCYVTEGVGGADALFGNKLCYFPASNEITSFSEKEDFAISMNYLDELLHPFFNSRLNNIESGLLSMKEYNSVMLSPLEFEKMIDRLSDKLYRTNKILEKTAVKSIVKTSDELFGLTTTTGQVFVAENVVLGSGKSSNNFLRSTFKDIGVDFSENYQDIGIRIETNSENFSENFYYQNDPKIKFTYPSLGSGRTFCAITDGQVVPVQFGNSFYADGIFTKESKGLNNIALMVRSDEELEANVLEKWCKEINKELKNNLFAGEINLKETNSADIPELIMSKMPFWPTKKHKDVMRLLLNDLFLGNHNILVSKKNILDFSLKIYAPAIDNYLPRPVVKMGFKTNIKNFYVVGDAVGVSRGYVQALFSGVAWANSISNENLEYKLKKEQWSVSA